MKGYTKEFSFFRKSEDVKKLDRVRVFQMTTIEAIYKKVQYLDALRLQELNDFLDFLLQKKKMEKSNPRLFPLTELEAPDSVSPYSGKSLSLEEMDDAIHFEAEQRS